MSVSRMNLTARMLRVLPVAGLALFLAILSLGPARAEGSGNPLDIVVSILPQVDLVKRLGGDQVTVQCLIGPGQSHGVFEPKPQDLARLSRCDLFLGIGFPFERHLVRKAKAVVPGLRFHDLSEGIALRELEGGHTHSEGCSHSSEEGKDPHLWLDPAHLRTLTLRTTDLLSGLRPDSRDLFTARAASFTAALIVMEQRLLTLLAPVRGRSIMVFHPAFGYFLDRFGIKQIPIELEGKDPGPRELVRLIRLARAEGIRTLFTQPQFTSRSVQAIADAIQAEVVPLDPMAPDLLATLQAMGEHIARALAPRP